jgi:zinc transport system substrate-binding protein
MTGILEKQAKGLGSTLTALVWATLVLLAFLLGAAGCQSKKAGTASSKPVAVATIFAYYDALRAIGDGDVQAVILLPPRQSPHSYQPTIQDRAAVAQAALFIKNGLSIDPWADKLTSENRSAVVLEIAQILKAKGLSTVQTEEVSVTPASQAASAESEDVSAGNPHIWLDPRVQMAAAEAVRDALIRIDPAHGANYTARADRYLAELRKLDSDFAAAARQFKQREFIGFHSAYAYLANRYGLHQVAAVEELPGEGPSLAQQANIIRLIKDKGIHVIFMESAFPAQAARRIVAETGVKTGILQPLETYDSPDETYVSLMRQNLKALQEVLQ